MDWPEEVQAKEELDRLMRVKYGEQPQGKHRSLADSANEWTITKTSELLNEPRRTTETDIQLAKATKEYPELAKIKTKQGALVELKKIKDKEKIKTLIAPAGKFDVIVMKQNSLIIFTKAARMLVEADTIQKAKELKDLALTAADWAKRKGMGEEAIGYAKSYAMRAEIRMGEMLAQTERNVGAKGSIITGDIRVPVKDQSPTLAELGLSKRESSEAQR